MHKHINSIRKVKYGIPALRSAGRVAATPVEGAEMLKTQYSNVFAALQVDGLQLPPRLHHLPYPALTYVSFTTDNVKAKLMALRKNATPGADKMHPKSMIFLVNRMSESLASLFQ
ncbi:unnamed protein product [Echinostoma caproni]|uniref:Reverse transcriptase domain-containing protein n=1 Tax=Echinostoma caproni TaxID=27848 RepID=A0A183AEW4_9TREM|nr:unnamed protein product [Echinostoma caproni]